MKQAWQKLKTHVRSDTTRFWSGLGIQKKILLFFICFALFVVAIVSIYLGKSATQSIRNETTETLMEVLNQTAINVDHSFNQVEDTCFRMRTDWDLLDIFFQKAEDYDFKQQNRDYYSVMDIYSSNMVNRNISDIRLYMNNGGFYVNMDWVCRPLEEAMEKPWHPVASAEKYQWVSYTDTQEDIPVFTVSCIRAVQRRDVIENNSVVGYMELKLNQLRLQDILKDTSTNISSDLYILGEDSLVYASSNGTTAGEPFIYKDDLTKMLAMGQYEMAMPSINAELLIYPKENIVIAAVVPEKVLLQGMSSFWVSAISMILAVIIISIALSSILSSNITKRVAELCQAMETISIEGDTLLPERSNDEITQLARNTNDMIRLNRKLLNEVYLVRIAKREAEMSALQAQITPHFLYNTLDAINWMALRHHATDVSHMVCLLAKYFRLTLNQGKRIITIRDELEHVRVYLEIMKVRSDGTLEYTIDVEEDLQEIKIVKLLLQPIVENAISHGLMENSNSNGKILIRGKRRNQEIVLSVTDNGVGIAPDILQKLKNHEPVSTKKGGYGLNNVNSRIQLYYGESYALHIDSELGNGTTVEVHLPDLHDQDENG